MKKNTFRLLSAILFLPFVMCDTADAQQASIAITPVSIDAQVKPGTSYSQTFTVSNNTGERLTVYLSSNDMWFDENNKRITAPAGTQDRSASRWLHFTPSEIIVEPNGTGMVKATITVPRDATGSFYTVPVFEAMPTRPVQIASTNLSATTIGIRFRGLIMLTTTTGSEYNLELMSAAIKAPSASSVFELNLDLKNRGTAHVKARGSYAIIDAAGKLAGRGTIEPHRFLPGQRYVVKSKWAGALKPGTYMCLLTVSHDRVGQPATSLAHELTFTVK